jgi:hypothetical protein
MTAPAHRRALCPHCKRICEQRHTTELVGGQAVPSLTCIECLTTYAYDSRDEPMPETEENACPLCTSGTVTHRVVRDPSGAELPATDCVDCEALCLRTRVATDHERVESERNLALEAKCGLLSISLRQADARVLDLEAQLIEVQTVRDALTAQLRLCERKAASLRPARDERPCVHCGEVELTRVHLVAGGGHSFEAAP